MLTVNQKVSDALIAHQILVLRYAEHLANQTAKILAADEKEIALKIKTDLIDHDGLTPRSIQKMSNLISAIVQMRENAFGQVVDLWQKELNSLKQNEVEFMITLLSTLAPVVLDLAKPTGTDVPMQGQSMVTWFKQLKEQDTSRIAGQIRMGVVQRETSNTISNRVVGTRGIRGTTGVTQTTRMHADAIIRTAVLHTAANARSAVVEANAQLFTEDRLTTMLDGKTTCGAMDGKSFDIGMGPKPPLHFRCRSMRIPIFNGSVLGTLPLKPKIEIQWLGEFARQQGIPPPSSRADLPDSSKKNYPKFITRKIREIVGTTPNRLSYQIWLANRSASFQDDVLGPTRARLFRQGGLKLDRFTNRHGDEIPLNRLVAMERQAFIDAGLDPDAF